VHYSCYTGSGGAARSREPLAAVAAAVVLGSAECRAIDAAGVLEDLSVAARGSDLARDSGLVPTGGESQGGVGGVADAGGLLQA
jgi:hypothetical protein